MTARTPSARWGFTAVTSLVRAGTGPLVKGRTERMSQVVEVGIAYALVAPCQV
jgi:hypothetical protein